jgi:hypothetical protein
VVGGGDPVVVIFLNTKRDHQFNNMSLADIRKMAAASQNAGAAGVGDLPERARTPSRPPSRTGTTTPKPPAANKKLSAAAVKYANENILKKMKGELPTKETVQDEQKERASLFKQLEGYYNKFPEKVIIKDTKKWAKATNDELREEVKRFQSSISTPYAEFIVRTGVLWIVDAIEKYAADIVLDKAGYNIQGISAVLNNIPVEEGGIDISDEIKELAILWGEYLNQGPKMRLVVKVLQAAKVANEINKNLVRTTPEEFVKMKEKYETL